MLKLWFHPSHPLTMSYPNCLFYKATNLLISDPPTNGRIIYGKTLCAAKRSHLCAAFSPECVFDIRDMIAPENQGENYPFPCLPVSYLDVIKLMNSYHHAHHRVAHGTQSRLASGLNCNRRCRSATCATTDCLNGW